MIKFIKQNLYILKDLKYKNFYTFFKQYYQSNNKADWYKFINLLKDFGINYKSKYENDIKIQNNLKNKSKFSLELITKIDFENKYFMILNKSDFKVIWYEQDEFEKFKDIFYFELEVARKAIWVAKKIKENNYFNSIQLILWTNCNELLKQDNILLEQYSLTNLANKSNVFLNINYYENLDINFDEYFFKDFEKDSNYQEIIII